MASLERGLSVGHLAQAYEYLSVPSSTAGNKTVLSQDEHTPDPIRSRFHIDSRRRATTSDRWVFLIAFLTVVVVVAGAFAMPQFFTFELLKSLIFLAIALLVFFGKDRFSYMLGMVAPILGFVLNILLGGFFGEFKVLFGALTGKGFRATDTPLHGLSILLEIVLIIVCYRAWHTQVTEKFIGKTFWISFAAAFGYVAILAGWHFTHAL